MIDPLAAEAGPELDAAIATEVMGWTNDSVVWDGSPGRLSHSADQDLSALFPVWAPSTDANDALIVAEKAGVLDLFSLHRSLYRGKGAQEFMNLYELYDDPDDNRPVASAPIFPLLICRAALWLAREQRKACGG